MIRIIGSLAARDGRGVVRVEDRVDTDIADLWATITEPDRLARWFGHVEGDLRPGGSFRQHVTASGWTGTGRVEACEPPSRLVVVIRMDEDPAEEDDAEPSDERIEATLTADGDGMRLVVVVSGLPIDKLHFYGAGWQHHVEMLEDHLAGRELAGEARFEELVGPYEELARRVG